MTRIAVARVAYHAHLLNHECAGKCKDAQALLKKVRADII